jgi:hypothetical protein
MSGERLTTAWSQRLTAELPDRYIYIVPVLHLSSAGVSPVRLALRRRGCRLAA